MIAGRKRFPIDLPLSLRLRACAGGGGDEPSAVADGRHSRFSAPEGIRTTLPLTRYGCSFCRDDSRQASKSGWSLAHVLTNEAENGQIRIVSAQDRRKCYEFNCIINQLPVWNGCESKFKNNNSGRPKGERDRLITVNLRRRGQATATRCVFGSPGRVGGVGERKEAAEEYSRSADPSFGKAADDAAPASPTAISATTAFILILQRPDQK